MRIINHFPYFWFGLPVFICVLITRHRITVTWVYVFARSTILQTNKNSVTNQNIKPGDILRWWYHPMNLQVIMRLQKPLWMEPSWLLPDNKNSLLSTSTTQPFHPFLQFRWWVDRASKEVVWLQKRKTLNPPIRHRWQKSIERTDKLIRKPRIIYVLALGIVGSY